MSALGSVRREGSLSLLGAAGGRRSPGRGRRRNRVGSPAPASPISRRSVLSLLPFHFIFRFISVRCNSAFGTAGLCLPPFPPTPRAPGPHTPPSLCRAPGRARSTARRPLRLCAECGSGAAPWGATGWRSPRQAPSAFSRGALSVLPLFPSAWYAAIPISLSPATREPGAASRPPFPPDPVRSPAAAAARRSGIPRRAARGAVRQRPATRLPRGRLLGLENGGRRRRAARRALGMAPCTSCNGGAESDELLGSAAAAGSGTSSLLALGACRSPALSAAASKATRGTKGFLGSGGKQPSFRL